MLLLDVAPLETNTQIIVLAGNIGQPIRQDFYGAVGACAIVSTLPDVYTNRLNVADSAAEVFSYKKPNFDYLQGDLVGMIGNASIEIVEKPRHGRIVIVDGGAAEYVANNGYIGTDRASFIVHGLLGQSVKVVYNLRVLNSKFTIDNFLKLHEKHCPKDSWLISENSGSIVNSLSSAIHSVAGVEDLEGAALAQTTGTGKNAQITLDTNAAGHGWYIDYTPYLNDEYLPTSNPLEWIAKPGSEAENRAIRVKSCNTEIEPSGSSLATQQFVL